MKRLIVLVLSLAGCTSLPSIQACNSVRYERTGLDYTLTATCRVQVSDPVPIPVPAGL